MHVHCEGTTWTIRFPSYCLGHAHTSTVSSGVLNDRTAAPIPTSVMFRRGWDGEPLRKHDLKGSVDEARPAARSADEVLEYNGQACTSANVLTSIQEAATVRTRVTGKSPLWRVPGPQTTWVAKLILRQTIPVRVSLWHRR